MAFHFPNSNHNLSQISQKVDFALIHKHLSNKIKSCFQTQRYHIDGHRSIIRRPIKFVLRIIVARPSISVRFLTTFEIDNRRPSLVWTSAQRLLVDLLGHKNCETFWNAPQCEHVSDGPRQMRNQWTAASSSRCRWWCVWLRTWSSPVIGKGCKPWQLRFGFGCLHQGDLCSR